jgi:glycerol-3-phosphate dehydrogenase
LRYLEHGEVHLVRQSLRERDALLRTAPHLVKPLTFLIPIYKGSKRGRMEINVGLTFYDMLGRKGPLPRHHMLSRDEVLARVPGLNRVKLVGGAIYFDAQVEFPERLVVENVITAYQHGASVRTYSKLDSFRLENGQIRGVEFTDQTSGENVAASATAVVNAAGPWVDEVLKLAGHPSEPLLGGTKGSHIVVSRFEGAPSDALYVEAEQDRRPFFVIPWNNLYLIGTTDYRFTGDLDHVHAEPFEVEYLLYETNRLFPQAQLQRESILFTSSGVRPLAFSRQSREARITRRHFIREHKNVCGLFSIIGGKLTTYRQVAEETVDLLERRFRLSGALEPGKAAAPRRSHTVERDLIGASDFEDFRTHFREESGLPSHLAERLLRIYGTRAEEIRTLTRLTPSLLRVFDPETGAIAAEVVFAFESEFARTLTDCILRRTMVGFNSACGLNAVQSAGEIARTHLGWSEERVEIEVIQYEQYVQKYLRAGLSGGRGSM